MDFISNIDFVRGIGPRYWGPMSHPDCILCAGPKLVPEVDKFVDQQATSPVYHH